MIERFDAGLVLRPEIERAEGDARAADGRVDHVGDDGRGGGHLSRAQAVEEDRPDGVADDLQGVERSAHFGQRRAHLYQRRRDVQFQAAVVQVCAHGDQLDAVAQFFGIAHVGRVERVDADAGNVAPMDAGTERQVGQNRQLLRGVAAADVHRRIGLGIAQALGLLQGGGVVGPLLLHLRDDEVASCR